MDASLRTWDVIIAGAGAAGLATAIFTRSRNANRSVLLLDGARRPGAKILVSGGARCNVTNTVVSERDYWGGPRTIIRRVLRAFPVSETVAFFQRAGVALHEEADGKLFPDSNRARDVLDALLRLSSESGVAFWPGRRVTAISRRGDLFDVIADGESIGGRTVVLATGGQSLPKSGSDGAGYAIARSFGHTIVQTTPALVPLVLESSDGIHTGLSGVSTNAELTLWVDGAASSRLRGALLWTHFGISGPVVLDMSRHWLRAKLEGRTTRLTASFVPGRDFSTVDALWRDRSRSHGGSSISSFLTRLVPASMSEALCARLHIDPGIPLAHFGRDDRRRLSRALVEWPLDVRDSRGYNYAEATAGGVNLREIDPGTMESRRCAGLFLVGEILDVDGRIGGFNFQWAWSSAYVAASRLASGTTARD